MSTVKWADGPMAALDFESSGVDPLEDRIITTAVVHHIPGSRPRAIEWLIHPGIDDIPDEAAQVHGWTTERLERRLAGREAIRITPERKTWLTRDGALFEIAGQVASAIGNGIPLVAHNAAFDLTLLETELVRNDIDTIASRPAGITGVVDPMVIEKAYDGYRRVCYRAPGCDREAGHHECGGCRGGRHQCGGCGATDKTLTNLARHYGTPLAGAHAADADALAAIRLARRLAGLWPEIARWKLPTLHRHQVEWRREQSDSLRKFWREQGDERWREVDSAWPLHTALTTHTEPQGAIS